MTEIIQTKPDQEIDMNAEAVALVQQLDVKITENLFEWITANLEIVRKPGKENGKIPIQNLTVSYNGESRKIALKGGDVIIQALESYNKDENTIDIPWSSARKKSYKLTDDVYWCHVKSTNAVNKKAITLSNKFYKERAIESFTLVSAKFVDKDAMGNKEGILTQGITCEYNGEERKLTLEGSTLIVAAIKSIDLDEKTITIPWSSKIPRQYSQSNENKNHYWVKL